MQRDLYAEVSARIIAELEQGGAPWVKPWSAAAGQNVPPERRDQPALFGLQRCPFVACARSGLGTAAVPDVQAG